MPWLLGWVSLDFRICRLRCSQASKTQLDLAVLLFVYRKWAITRI